jgi:hypothetical protein
LPFALRAWVGNHGARPAARWTRTRQAERQESLARSDNLAAAGASAASRGAFPGRRSAAAAGIAHFLTAHAGPGGVSENRFLEFQRQIVPQIAAPLGARAPAASAAKEIAKAKNIAQVPEEIAKILEDAGIEAAGRHIADSGVAETVVQSSFFPVGQNGVGFAAFLEAFFRFRIVGIAVRVVLQRQPPVGALDFLLAGLPADAEDFVVIAFGVGIQDS